ncbi:hypothetical protein BRARA_B02211 [Brassica rapa]|uniref:BnaA02g17500D protein n=3 Tax=Brassica TaxID=3705 RepID=T1SRV8_BRANA|nr:defensin-like protein 1 [Brassica rapa]XP_013718667.1 defensin-like protein 1 [Brassica napus]AGT51222.1 defensin [Brassica napus]KAH0938565.1 hypothetical protein HID58_006026 [Brassica napus]RID75153.1 hypothetical protein BRARA_B02211 [Brassica rapa]CAF2140247.1 unnamed protein product [Brassica napus]CAG7893638.1 unnamed protein product [Brassica rapa]
MAKFASIITLIFAALILFAAFEAPTKVEGQKLCRKPSGTWSGLCANSDACRKQCIRLEKARDGSCKYEFPAHKCFCYYPC